MDGEEELDREENMLGLDLSLEDDPEFAIEVTVENDQENQHNYFFLKKLTETPVIKSP